MIFFIKLFYKNMIWNILNNSNFKFYCRKVVTNKWKRCLLKCSVDCIWMCCFYGRQFHFTEYNFLNTRAWYKKFEINHVKNLKACKQSWIDKKKPGIYWIRFSIDVPSAMEAMFSSWIIFVTIIWQRSETERYLLEADLVISALLVKAAIITNWIIDDLIVIDVVAVNKLAPCSVITCWLDQFQWFMSASISFSQVQLNWCWVWFGFSVECHNNNYKMIRAQWWKAS